MGIVGSDETLLVLENIIDALVAKVILEEAQDPGFLNRVVRKNSPHLTLVIFACRERGIHERLVRNPVGQRISDGIARLARC
jgi:hypothetical protein